MLSSAASIALDKQHFKEINGSIGAMRSQAVKKRSTGGTPNAKKSVISLVKTSKKKSVAE